MRRLRRLAILASEFADPELGRIGGFGWAARAAARTVSDLMGADFEPLLVSAEHSSAGLPKERLDGTRLIGAPPDPAGWRDVLRRERPDALLTIDYRPAYAPVMRALSRVPVLVWIRDARTAYDIEKIASLRIPGSPAAPEGIRAVDCSELAQLLRRRMLRPRQISLASPAPALVSPKVPAVYGVEDPRVTLLPNPLQHGPRPEASPGRSVAYLGRLDPIKRPWVAVEVARRMPEVDFVFMGQSHFSGTGSWQPQALPPNVSLLGHVEGERKRDVLASATALVNTSIHESLPVSFLEALGAGVPIVSCQDPEGVASRFGAYVGRYDGDGLEAVDAFVGALRPLLEDRSRRDRLGELGRRWVTTTHTRERFADGLRSLLPGAASPALFSRS